MQKQIYTTQNFRAQKAVENPAPSLQPVAQAVVVPSSARRARRVGTVMLVLCMVLAVLAVMLVPLIASGASSAGGVSTTMAFASVAPLVAESKVAYDSLEAAQDVVGFKTTVPSALPENATVTAYRVIDGAILEIEYAIGRTTVRLRTALGRDDVSGDATNYAYTTTEEVDGVARGYAGITETKWCLAVWADGNRSYAVLADGGIDADTLRVMAESVG